MARGPLDLNLVSGRSPVSIAAAAVYMVCNGMDPQRIKKLSSASKLESIAG